jgi:hypothetical protein
LGQTFFGLTSEYKVHLHQNIFSLIYYGNGGFTFDTVYTMPVYLRTFYMKQLEDVKKKEAEMIESATKKGKQTSKR